MLKSMFAKWMRSAGEASAGPARPVAADDPPIAGDVYAFRTSPCTRFSPPVAGRHAAFRLLAVDDRLIRAAVLDGIWPAPPSFAEASRAAILQPRRFPHLAGKPALIGIALQAWRPGDLDGLVLLGNRPVSPREQGLAATLSIYATLRAIDSHAEGEWRWRHDRAAFDEEIARSRAAAEAERAARIARRETRLKGLTWDRLLAETPFERWTPSPPFPPPAFTQAARATIHDACRALRDLGRKPRKADVRRILKGCVLWFNAEDARAGDVIETEEREDICALLEEMAFVARQEALVEEIDGWRDW